MAVSDCRKNKIAVPKKKQKMPLVDNKKKYPFSVLFFLFSSFLFSFLFLILFFLFLGERRKKDKKSRRDSERFFSGSFGFPQQKIKKSGHVWDHFRS